MSGTFVPRLDILPPVQRALWPKLQPVADLGMVLYGGTAIALRLGHRSSVDFDFFSDRPLDETRLRSTLDFLADATVLQQQPDTLTVMVSDKDTAQPVKVSFFGSIDFGRLGDPEWTEDRVLCVASFDDLMATKLKVILQRVESKDYQDIVAMLGAGVRLDRGLAGARLLFGKAFQPSDCLKALTYFEGGDLHKLTDTDRRALIESVRAVGDLPEIELRSRRLRD